MHFPRNRLSTAATLLIGLVVNSSPLHAQQLSAAEAATAASQSTGGRVLKVDTINSGNGDTNYRVKLLLPEGKVRNIIIDGDNGQHKE